MIGIRQAARSRTTTSLLAGGLCAMTLASLVGCALSEKAVLHIVGMHLGSANSAGPSLTVAWDPNLDGKSLVLDGIAMDGDRVVTGQVGKCKTEIPGIASFTASPYLVDANTMMVSSVPLSSFPKANTTYIGTWSCYYAPAPEFRITLLAASASPANLTASTGTGTTVGSEIQLRGADGVQFGAPALKTAVPGLSLSVGACQTTPPWPTLCPLRATFSPTSIGKWTGQIEVPFQVDGKKGAGSPVRIPFELAAQGPLVSPTTTTLQFGSRLVGSATTQTLVITNKGAGILNATTTSSRPDYQASSDCANVAQHATCSVLVTFVPQSAGPLPGALLIKDSQGVTTSVILTGTGVAPPTPTPSPSQSNVSQ